jgi:hypothetical protein
LEKGFGKRQKKKKKNIRIWKKMIKRKCKKERTKKSCTAGKVCQQVSNTKMEERRTN